jgi:hypothetical protein
MPDLERRARACVDSRRCLGRARPWAMRKLLKCLLLGHDWRWEWNDEGQKYEECARCGANRDRGSEYVGAPS